MPTKNYDAIKSNPAVLRVYAQYVKLQRDGQEYIGVCPFHDEKTPSFKIFRDRDGVILFKCFGCGQSGNVFQFVQKMDKCRFQEAVKKVEEIIGTWEQDKQRVEQAFQPMGRDDRPVRTLSLEQWQKFEQALANNQAAKDWLKNERGIKYETARKLHFGFRQDVGKLAGGQLADIAASGWLAFPCIENGIVVSIKYRSIQRKGFCRQPNMATVLFNLSALDPLETIFVTEGEFDAAVLTQAGFRAVSLPSAQFKVTPEMKDALLAAETIILAGDSGTIGQQAMAKLWAELGDRTYLLHWPNDLKDANEVFLKAANQDVSVFRTMVEELTVAARANPMPSVHSMAESMATSTHTNLADHPRRLRFPWPDVDRMAILLPGSVMTVSATNTKMGKTIWTMNVTTDEARRGEVVLNYQCELTVEEFANIMAAYVLRKDRNKLDKTDYTRASQILKASDVKYYVGRDPTLVTVTPVLDLIEAAVRRLGATIVVLDHIHFICRNEKDEIQAQANAMQRIKNMAVKYGLKFIVVGQPRKADKQNKGKVIHVTDLKGSEVFGSDADAIFAIHRNFVKVIDPNNPPRDPYDSRTEIHLLGARSKGDGNSFAGLQFHGNIAAFWQMLPMQDGVVGEGQSVLQ